MRLHVLSDLHLEFGGELPPVPACAEAVVLAGDIAVGEAGLEAAARIAEGRGLPVVYVSGNHELYHQRVGLIQRLRAHSQSRDCGVHFLENDVVQLGGVRFLGCALWTDFALFGAEDRANALRRVEGGLADYAFIRHEDGRLLRARDTLSWHEASVSWLAAQLAMPFEGPTVVVTHHAPSSRSVPERYRRDGLSPGFASPLDHLLDGERLRLWLHGHTHHSVDYEAHGVRVVANQRGYPREADTGFRPGLLVDV